MKGSGHCPKCAAESVLKLGEVADLGTFSGGARAPTVRQIARYDGGWIHVGHLEAYVCRACGYSELYTRNPDVIVVDGERVVLL